MVVLQMKVPQIALVRQLVDNVSKCFTFCLSARESFGTPCSSVAVVSCQTGGSLLFALVQLATVLEEPTVRDLRHHYLVHVFFFFEQVPSLMLVPQVVCHPHLHLHACLVHELGMLVFALTWQKFHVSSGDQVAHATWSLADTVQKLDT